MGLFLLLPPLLLGWKHVHYLMPATTSPIPELREENEATSSFSSAWQKAIVHLELMYVKNIWIYVFA